MSISNILKGALFTYTGKAFGHKSEQILTQIGAQRIFAFLCAPLRICVKICSEILCDELSDKLTEEVNKALLGMFAPTC